MLPPATIQHNAYYVECSAEIKKDSLMAQNAPALTLDEACQQFVREVAGSPCTIKTYATSLKVFVQFVANVYCKRHLAQARDFPLSDFSESVLADFFKWLGKAYNSRATRATYMAAARRFFTWLDAGDYLPPAFHLGKASGKLAAARGKNKREAYKHKPVDLNVPRIVTYYDDLPLPAADSPRARQKRLILLRNRALSHVLYASGGRVSEVVALTRAQVQDGRATQAPITGKGDKDRMLLLTCEAQQAIQAYLSARSDRSPALFISHGRRGQNDRDAIARNMAWRIVEQAARALELPKGISPHQFRHYRATQLLNEGMPLETVQMFLGHADIGTTRKIYAHTNTAVLVDQLATYGLARREAIEHHAQ
jgi:site-specific recombinase XerD